MHVPQLQLQWICPERVNIAFSVWVIDGLDREARLLGITRQSLVKMWIAEKFRTGNKALE